jgi:molecular chaperone DnaK
MEFSNATDMQPNATIMVYSGNRPMAYQNKLLGQFNIELTPSPRGMNKIEVLFDIDANGILTVSAVDKALNKPNKITIESKSSLTQEEIDRMKAEAEVNAEADKKQKEEADKLNGADSFAFSVQKSMEEFGGKVKDDDKSVINPLIEEIKKAVQEHNVEKAEQARKTLEEKWTPIITKIYQENGGTGANSTSNPFSGTPFGDMFNNAQTFNGGAPTGGNTTQQPTEENADFEEVK